MNLAKRKKLFPFIKKNYFLVIFGFCMLFVGVVAFGKLFISKPTYIYVKIKVGQGLWWATTAKPSIWYIKSIKEGDVAKSLLGSVTAQVLSKRYYRYYGGDQYDMYMTLKLKADYNKNNGAYSFNRSVISISSPIDIQFPTVDITGTVTDLSKNSFEDKYYEKIITLSKRNAFPWEFEAIKTGDKYFDGESTIFEVLEKNANDSGTIVADKLGNLNVNNNDPTKNITVMAKVMLRKINDQWILGEDQLVSPGRTLSISTTNFVFDAYIVSSIQ